MARKSYVLTLLGLRWTPFLSGFSPPSFSSDPVPIPAVRIWRIVCSVMSLFRSLLVPQVALLDIDICGPSIPKIMGLEGEQVRAA